MAAISHEPQRCQPSWCKVVPQPAVLIFGGTGQLGTALRQCGWPACWQIETTARSDIDLRNTEAISNMIASREWAAVINAGAYTAVDAAESDIVNAWAVNALAPAAMAAGCARTGIPLIHVSTDYVFPGDTPGRWLETDPTAPTSVYGASKLGGEIAVQTSGARFLILRTAWVVSAHGKNFVSTMLHLARDRERIGVVDDQFGTPTAATDLAATVRTLTTSMVEDASRTSGTVHFTNKGECSWADFAEEIFRQSVERGGPHAIVDRITTAQYPTPARRPANSVLNTEKIKTQFAIFPRPWEAALSDILDELIGPML